MKPELPAPSPSAGCARPFPPSRTVFEVHGTRITDDFAWLKAENWQEVLKDPARSIPRSAPSWSGERLRGRGLRRHRGVPEAPRGGNARPHQGGRFLRSASRTGRIAYFTRYREGGQHPLVCRQPRDGGMSRAILLDGDKEAEGPRLLRSRRRRSFARPPADGLERRHQGLGIFHHPGPRPRRPARICRTRCPAPPAAWSGSANSSGFYYVELDENHRPVRVKRHRLGTAPSRTRSIYEETDPGFFVKLGLTQSGAFVLIEASDHETSEVRLLDRADPPAAPRLVEPRTPRLQYDVEHHGDDLIILTNADGAEDFKIMTAPVANPGPRALARPRPLPAGHDDPLRTWRCRAISCASSARMRSRASSCGSSPPAARRPSPSTRRPTRSASIAGYEFDTDVIRYHYSSMTTPSEVTDYDLRTGDADLAQAAGGAERPRPGRLRHPPPVRDGARRRAGADLARPPARDVALDGSAPCLLYGYGSYGMSMPAALPHQHPVARRPRLRLCDRPCPRRHREGLALVLDGKREKKPNTLHGFHRLRRGAGQRRLHRARGRIVAHGGSAGGMLMGAVANLAPELFAGIVAEVPFVDVLNTMLDASCPSPRRNGPNGAIRPRTRPPSARSCPTRPTTTSKPQAYPAILALGGPDRSARHLLGAGQMGRAAARRR